MLLSTSILSGSLVLVANEVASFNTSGNEVSTLESDESGLAVTENSVLSTGDTENRVVEANVVLD